MDVDDPKTWDASTGGSHPDFDPIVDVEMLRRVALMLTGREPSYSVRLGAEDPGYRSVEIRKNGIDHAELHVVLGETKHSPLRYGLFLLGPLGADEDGGEEYFQSADGVVEYLIESS